MFNYESCIKDGKTKKRINLFKKWTIVRPSCFAPKKGGPRYISALKKSRPRYISAQKISFAMELTG